MIPKTAAYFKCLAHTCCDQLVQLVTGWLRYKKEKRPSDAPHFLIFSGWRIWIIKSSAWGSYNESLGDAINRTDLGGILICPHAVQSACNELIKITFLFHQCSWLLWYLCGHDKLRSRAFIWNCFVYCLDPWSERGPLKQLETVRCKQSEACRQLICVVITTKRKDSGWMGAWDSDWFCGYQTFECGASMLFVLLLPL